MDADVKQTETVRGPRGLEKPRRRRRGRLLGACLALAGIVAGASATGVGAQSTGCAAANGNCVIVIHVAGLEPKDVTRETTPFLWAMGHPSEATSQPFTTILQHRAGFTWEAPRTTMPAGTAPAAAALLTGGDPREIGIPSDHYREHRDLLERRLAIDLGSMGSASSLAELQVSANDLPDGVQTMPTMLDDQLGDDAQSAAFLGDPGLADLVAGPVPEDGLTWYPRPAHPEFGSSAVSGTPFYCPPPRNPGYEGGDYTGQGGTCIAADGQVLNQAVNILSSTAARNVAYAYIHLAELGAVKQRSTDVDDPQREVDFGGLSNVSIASTLQQTDAMLAALLGQYQQNVGDKFSRNTTVFVIGDHGYESTPVAQRIPHPDEPALDLEAYIEDRNPKVDFVPQGTTATVYCNAQSGDGGGCDKSTVLPKVRKEIDDLNDSDVCESTSDVTEEGCIEEVLYVRAKDAPAGSPTVAGEHPDWKRLDHINFDDKGNIVGPSGASGELLVTTTRGWSTGRVVPPALDLIEGKDDLVTNPWMASAGGPRNRAIAAIVNGPIRTGQGNLRNLPGGLSHFPVFTRENDQSTETNPRCEQIPGRKFSSIAQANANPAEDANASGHLCQLEIRDVLPTIAALMQVAVPPDQLSGRILNEAFPGLAAAPCRFDCPPDPIIPDTFLTKGPICGEQVGGQCTPQQEDGRIPGVAQTTERVNSFEFIGFPGDEITAFDCRLDGGAWQRCSSPYTTPSFAPKTQHTFQVRAISDAGIDPTPATIAFEIIPIFDCDRPVCAIDARAKKKRKLQITGAFGNQTNLVTLSFYRKVTPKNKKQRRKMKKANCGTAFAGTLLPAVERKPKTKSKKAEKRRRKVAKRTAGAKKKVKAGKRCRVKTLATFAPIQINRGELKSTLKVPRHFSKKRAPTHLGLFIEEAVPREVSRKKVSKCEKGEKVKKGKKPPVLCELRPIGKRGSNAAGIIGIKKAKNLR